MEFTCHGCGKSVTINKSVPRQRVFVWKDGKTGKPHNYCYSCDDLLIQDQPLPKSKRK